MKKIMILMAAVILSCGTAMAQRNNGGQRGQRGQMSQEEMAKMRSENIKRQAESLAKDMKLPKDKQADFITDYSAYQEELQSITTFNMNAFNNRQEQKKVKDMTDDECLEKVTEVITRQEEQANQATKRLEVIKKWIGKFMEKEYDAHQLYQIFAEQRRAASAGAAGFGGQGGMRMGGGAGGFGGGFPGGGAGGFGGGFPGGGF